LADRFVKKRIGFYQNQRKKWCNSRMSGA
jgi:hypothetical protein